MTYYLPERIMGCTPFLQKLGFLPVLPRQSMSLDINHIHAQHTPTEYPIQNVHQMPSSRVDEPYHGVSELWPWSEPEIHRNSNQ
jgi:hypothetical protein